MSSAKSGDVKEAKQRIQYHIDELEVKIKNSKTYWHRCEYNFDKNFVLGFIDCHYNEIVNHVAQIKHHLEKISYHKKELEDVKIHFVRNSPVNLDKNEQKTHENATIRRSGEDKQRFKNLRASRCSSSKYVHQWEKMIGENKEENVLNVTKRRPKGGAKSTTKTAENEDISKKMVQSRVLQFDKNPKSRRASSTIDDFLDFCLEKPARGVSCPIIEEADELNEYGRPKTYDFETASGDNNQASPVSLDSQKMLKDKLENRQDVSAKRELSDDNYSNGLDKLETVSEGLLNEVFQSCVDVQAQEQSVDAIDLKGKNEDKSGDLQKMEKHQFKSCVCIQSRDNNNMECANEDNPCDSTTNEDLPKVREFKSCIDVNSNEKPLNNNLKDVNEDKPGNTAGKKDLQEEQENLGLKNGFLQLIVDAKPVTDPVITQKKNLEKCESKQTTKKLPNNNVRDIIDDKVIVSESKLELLDDVKALIEDDHLMIIKKEKEKLPMEKASNSEKCDNEAIPANSFRKPRIIEIHYKKDLPPDVRL